MTHNLENWSMFVCEQIRMKIMFAPSSILYYTIQVEILLLLLLLFIPLRFVVVVVIPQISHEKLLFGELITGFLASDFRFIEHS